MSYPQRSNARLGITDSLWWMARYQDQEHVCQSQGGTVIADLQRIERQILPRAYTLNGVAFDREQINVDSNFGVKTFAGLRRILEDTDVPADVLADVDADYLRLVSAGELSTGARGQPLRYGTQVCLIWIAEHRNLPFSAMAVPTDIVTALFSIDAAAEEASGQVHCDLRSDLDRQVPQIYVDVPPETQASEGGDNTVAVLLGVVALGGLAILASGKRMR